VADKGFASSGLTCKLGAWRFESSVMRVDSEALRNRQLRQAAKR